MLEKVVLKLESFKMTRRKSSVSLLSGGEAGAVVDTTCLIPLRWTQESGKRCQSYLFRRKAPGPFSQAGRQSRSLCFSGPWGQSGSSCSSVLQHIKTGFSLLWYMFWEDSCSPAHLPGVWHGRNQARRVAACLGVLSASEGLGKQDRCLLKGNHWGRFSPETLLGIPRESSE